MNQHQSASHQQPLRVLFVCLGNICRSPLAEVVVQGVADERGLSDMFHFESAGTGSWHIGNGADTRSAATAKQHGLSLANHRAQQITPRNIHDWDVFVAMDQANQQDLLDMGVKEEQVLMMRAFEDENQTYVQDVPDPYYGGAHGFEDAFQMLTRNADGLLQFLQGFRG